MEFELKCTIKQFDDSLTQTGEVSNTMTFQGEDLSDILDSISTFLRGCGFNHRGIELSD